jgi:hypothetical protein
VESNQRRQGDFEVSLALPKEMQVNALLTTLLRFAPAEEWKNQKVPGILARTVRTVVDRESEMVLVEYCLLTMMLMLMGQIAFFCQSRQG